MASRMGERIWRPVWTWGALSILVALGTWARMDGLGDWGLWRDEAQCVFIAQKAFPAGIVDALLGEAHPPLYYSLQHFWMQLVGWSEFRIRFLSVIFGILLIPALFIAGRRLFGTGAGLGAAVFGALAPLHVAVSQTARMYSLLALLALLSVWFLFEAWQRGGWWWAGYVLATLGVLYTHNWALFLVVAQNAFALWMMLTRQTFRSRVLPWVGIQVSIGVLFMPWFVMILQQIPIISVLPFVPRLAPVDTLWRVGGDLLAAWPALLLWLAALALAIWPRMKWEPATEERDGALALAVWCSLGALAIGLIVSLQTYGGAPSYVTLVAFPALCLLLGRGLARVRRPWLALPLAALIAYLSFVGIERFQYGFRSSLREIAATVQREAGPNDMIVIAPDYLATTFNTYYRGDQPQIAFPWTMGRLEEIDCTGWSDRWYHAAEATPATLEAIDSQLGEGDRVWLVAALDEYPGDLLYYEQVRQLKAQLDTRYGVDRAWFEFRHAAEWADIYVYVKSEAER
jgi:mannosyltransferase